MCLEWGSIFDDDRQIVNKKKHDVKCYDGKGMKILSISKHRKTRSKPAKKKKNQINYY